MADTRHKDVNWNCGENVSFDGAKLAVLMDIRDELQTLNRLLACRNFTGIPASLRAIQRNTKKDTKP